jgi:hypothetical protein
VAEGETKIINTKSITKNENNKWKQELKHPKNDGSTKNLKVKGKIK